MTVAVVGRRNTVQVFSSTSFFTVDRPWYRLYLTPPRRLAFIHIHAPSCHRKHEKVRSLSQPHSFHCARLWPVLRRRWICRHPCNSYLAPLRQGALWSLDLTTECLHLFFDGHIHSFTHKGVMVRTQALVPARKCTSTADAGGTRQSKQIYSRYPWIRKRNLPKFYRKV